MAKGSKTKRIKEPTNRLSKPEILEMEKIIMKGKQKILDEQFHKRLTDRFNKSSARSGKPLHVKQVQNFFRKRKRDFYRNMDSLKTPDVITATDTSVSNNVAYESSSDLLGVKELEKVESKPKRGRPSQVKELEKAESKPKRGRSSQAKELEKSESKPRQGRSANCFTESEVQKLERIIEAGKQNILDEKFHKKLTNQFNKSPSRTRKPLQLKQVQKFFEEKKSAVVVATDLSKSAEEVAMITGTSDSNNAADEKSSDLCGVHSSEEKMVDAPESNRKRGRPATNSKMNKENLPQEKQVEKIEKSHKEGKDEVINSSCCKQLTEEFNNSQNQAGNKDLLQVNIENQKPPISMDIHEPSNELVGMSEPNFLDNAAHERNPSILDYSASGTESSSDSEEDTMENDAKQEDMEFEAKSLRDNAWYDVATFLSHRVLTTGESEVKVRFLGFDSDHDEWLNIKKYIRQRSIPLEASDCKRFQVGDLVLCYQETSDHAMYFDAHIIGIEKVEHEEKSCKCHFLIRFDHDQTEEKVRLKGMCRRPSLNQ